MKSRDTSVAELSAKLRIKPVTLYRYVGPKGELPANGKNVLNAWHNSRPSGGELSGVIARFVPRITLRPHSPGRVTLVCRFADPEAVAPPMPRCQAILDKDSHC